MEPIVQRLKAFLRYKGLSATAFSRQLQYRNCEKIARLFRNKGTKPSVRILEDIARYFPELDIRWLLTGAISATSTFLLESPVQSGVCLLTDKICQKDLEYKGWQMGECHQ